MCWGWVVGLALRRSTQVESAGLKEVLLSKKPDLKRPGCLGLCLCVEHAPPHTSATQAPSVRCPGARPVSALPRGR
eukprot:106528-Chlamydomonas_euryale.AAC.2